MMLVRTCPFAIFRANCIRYTRDNTLPHVYAYVHSEMEGENTKRRVRVHRISEFAVYLGAFAVARGKTQTSAVRGRERGERAVIGGVVSLPLFQRVQRVGEQGMGAKWKKGLLAG